MMMASNPGGLTVAIGAFLLTTGSALAADDVSRWDGDARSAARLIAGMPAAAGGVLRAGVEIRLKAGWHTYWRYPGDAGVPPQFDFKASQNVKRVDALWPAPQRLTEGAGVSIGYARDVIFPVQVIFMGKTWSAKPPSSPPTVRVASPYKSATA